MSAEDTTSQEVAAPIVEQEAQAPEQPTEEVAAQTEEGAEGEQQAKERDEKGRFKGVQPRIDELTRARREAEREAAYWRTMATQAASQAQTNEKPTPDKFNDYAEYVEALTDWKTEQKINERLQQEGQRRVEHTRAQTFEQRQAEFKAKAPDYDEVVGSSDAPVTEHVSAALLDSEVGPALMYHLAKNPQVLERLNRMTEAQANREIGRLEASLAQPAPAPAVKTTAAPRPASVLGSQGRGATLDPSRMSHEEYRAYRAKQGARWAR